METILKEVITNNAAFVAQHDLAYFKPHMAGQQPKITMVGCCDSRCQVHMFEPDPINKVFTVETIGNQMTSAQGSVDYGVLHLHTPVLLILGHTDCGAIKAFMKGYDKENDAIKRELDNLKPPLKTQVDPVAVFETELNKNILKNVDYQVETAMQRYQDLVAQKKLMIVGAVYDFLNTHGKGQGRVVIINLNGEKDPEKIKVQVPTLDLCDCVG